MNKDFEDKVKLIHDYFHSYGLRKTGGVIESHDEMLAMMSDPNKKNDFIKYVHEGFRLGQDILIAELIQNEKSRKELNGELKEHRLASKSRSWNTWKRFFEIWLIHLHGC